MLVSFEWLSDFLDVSSLTGETLADQMSRTGIEVEAVVNYGKTLSHLVVGEVMSMVDHPDSDHLHVCQVETGQGQLRQIVCGAPNVHVGAKVIVALPGAQLPGSIIINEGQLRGVTSAGMLCALQELGFPDNVVPKQYADGLFLLPADAINGTDIIDYLRLDDPILELSITPNRADALSMRGVAYEVGAIINQVPNFAPLEQVRKTVETELLEAVQVTVKQAGLAEAYEARVIRNVTVGQSPLWLQMRLMKAGIRPINNVVDITNYILIAYGQPLHAFDYERLPHLDIELRHAHEEEAFKTLDGVERHLSQSDVLVTAGQIPVALAGVMGGFNSEVTDATRHVLLETAVFDPINVRNTSKRLNLRSESSSRFEKGINPATISEAGEVAGALIAQLAGGELIEGTVGFNQADTKAKLISLTYQSLPKYLGIELKVAEIQHIFDRLGFGVTFGPDSFTVSVPARRWDISIEADILEEIVRIYGYDHLPATLPSVPSQPGLLSLAQIRKRQIRQVMESYGLNEVISYALTSPQQAAYIPSHSKLVKLELPMSEDRSILRHSLFSAMLDIVRYNLARQNKGLAFYEMGTVFEGQIDQALPKEQQHLALFVSGESQSKSWSQPAQTYSFFDVKGMIEGLFDAMHLSEQLRFESWTDLAVLHPGRSARILLKGQGVGFMGQIHPQFAADHDLEVASYYAEIDLDCILSQAQRVISQKPIPKYPSSARDLALLVPSHIAADSLKKLIQAQGGDLLVEVSLFDRYQKTELFQDKVSLAYHLVFQDPQATLKDSDIAPIMDQITKALLTVEGLEIR